TSTGTGSVNVVNPITLRGINFQSGTYSINSPSAQPLTLTNGGSGTLGVGEIQVGTGLTETINVPVAGSVGLNKTGSGTLVLNAAGTFSGGINVASGTLQMGAAGSFSVSNSATVGSAAFDLNGTNQTVSGLSFLAGAVNPVVTSGSGALTLNGDVNF